MTAKFVAALILAAGILIIRPAGAVELYGDFTQGGMVLGKAAPGSTVSLNGDPIKISKQGYFVFGFGRDAGGNATVTVNEPDGTVFSRDFTIAPRDFDMQHIDGLPPKMVTPPPEVLERIRRENAMIAEVRARQTDAEWFAEAFILPVDGPITGVYGSQRVLNGEPRRPHYGLDIAPPAGTEVVAPASGIVALAEKDLYYTGGTVMIDHGHGVTSVLMHLQDVLVDEDQGVLKGEIIGTVGATGRATGPHLDWRINWLGERIDPALVLKLYSDTPDSARNAVPNEKTPSN